MAHTFLYLFISLFASVAGAICGIGGGIIIKPVLDFFQVADASVISFLSGCTVLVMSLYSVVKSFLSQEKSIDLTTSVPLALGAVIGGILGKTLFNLIKTTVPNVNIVGGIQAICLAILTCMTFLYTLKKASIKTKQMKGNVLCFVVGCALGIFSSFLGIGGGPINLVVLGYCFSMSTKTAAINSLFIILFSQISTLITTLVTRTVPEFEVSALLLMICGGIAGGILGRKVNRNIESRAVDKLFMFLMVIIIFICIYNAFKFLA